MSQGAQDMTIQLVVEEVEDEHMALAPCREPASPTWSDTSL